MARKRKERALKSPTITIIGEGATERYYFTHLKRLNGFNYFCKPRNFTEQSLEEMQRQIERVLADDGIAVCVFDADVTRFNAAERQRLEYMRRKYAENPAVVLCDSMPSIEFWFLLHYLNTNCYFATSNEVISVLQKYLPAFSKQQLSLSKEQWVTELVKDGKLNTAISNAVAIGDNGESYSHLNRLFELLRQKITPAFGMSESRRFERDCACFGRSLFHGFGALVPDEDLSAETDDEDGVCTGAHAYIETFNKEFELIGAKH